MYELLLHDRTNAQSTGRSAPSVLLATALLVLSPAGVFGQSDQRSERARGARIYGTLCSRCHNARSPAEFSDRDWTTILMHMRTRTHMSRGEARAVEAFLRSSNRDARADRRAPNTDRRDRPSARRSRPLSGDSLGVLSPEATARLAEFLRAPPPSSESSEE